MLDLAEIEPPYRLFYHPIALSLLAGEWPRFMVNPYGAPTRLGVLTSDERMLAVTLNIPALCDSCGVR
jgi:hypothetical protein